MRSAQIFYDTTLAGTLVETNDGEYTFAYTNRLFKEINYGKMFPARYDRRHDLSIALMYDIHRKWSLGSNFVYGTGQAITMQEGRYFIEGNLGRQRAI